MNMPFLLLIFLTISALRVSAFGLVAPIRFNVGVILVNAMSVITASYYCCNCRYQHDVSPYLFFPIMFISFMGRVRRVFAQKGMWKSSIILEVSG